MARNKGGLFGNLFSRIKGKIEEIRDKRKQPKQPTQPAPQPKKPTQTTPPKSQPKKPTQPAPPKPQPKKSTKATLVKPTKTTPVKQVPVKPVEDNNDWNMSPEEIKFASMTTYEVTEYEKRHGKISVAPNMNFFAETVIGNFRRELQHFPAKAEPKLNQWLDRVISEYGTEDVANMLQSGRENGLVVTPDIAYDDELLEGYISDMLDYLPDMTDWYKAEIMDSMEEWYDVE